MGIQEKLEMFISRLEYARRVGQDKYMARCPAHNGDSVKLSVGLGRNGDRIVMNCLTRGCAAKEIMQAVGLTECDMFPDNPHEHVRGYRTAKNWVPEDDEFIVRIGLDQPRGQFTKKDWEKFQAAVKRESRRLQCNALEFYKNNTWSREV